MQKPKCAGSKPTFANLVHLYFSTLCFFSDVTVHVSEMILAGIAVEVCISLI